MESVKYYCINHSADKTSGTYPQAYDLPKGYDYHSTNSISSIPKFRRQAINLSIDLRVILSSQAKLTDIISCTFLPITGGLFISKRLLSILGKYKLPPHQVIEGQLYVDNKPITYYWIHFVSNMDDQVDFEKTVFYETNPATKTKQIIKINSDSDYTAKRQSLHILSLITSYEIYLKGTSYDILHVKYNFVGIFISERLLTELRENEISGYDVVPDCNLYCI